jgi:GntR family transcriptional regulator, transcriptional repressor for pyruvate dehydrogenase complex
MASDEFPALEINQAPRKKLAETVAQQILNAVRDLPPGTRLPPERELTQRLKCGRSTVREALNGLAMIGVIEIRHGQGVFVAEPPPIPRDQPGAEPKVITPELLEARRIIEVELARLAAERRTKEDLAAMGELLNHHRARMDDLERPVVEASQFHLLVADTARNPVLAAVVRPFFRLAFELGPQLYQTTEGYAHWELEQHTKIRDAIASGDGELARLRMLEHVTSMDPHYRGDRSNSATS